MHYLGLPNALFPQQMGAEEDPYLVDMMKTKVLA